MKKAKSSPLLRWMAMGAAVFSAVAGAEAQETLATLSKPVPQVLSRAVAIGKPAVNRTLHLCVTLAPPNEAAIESFANSVSNPGSPNYGQFVTPAQFGQKFGQSQVTFDKVRKYLTSKGLSVTMLGDNRLSILVDGTVQQAESSFHTTIRSYRSLDPSAGVRQEFYSYSTPLRVPSELAPVIRSVTGMDNHARPIPRFKRRAKQSGVTQPLTPQQTSTLYNAAPLQATNHLGQQRRIAISSFDGFDLQNVVLFYQQFGLPTPSGGATANISVTTVDGGSASGPASGEADLDQQMVLGQAPLCYLEIYDGGGDLQPVLAREAQDNTADIVTESYGWQYDAAEAEAAHLLHLQLSAQGITYFLASGDAGTSIDSSTPPATYSDYDTEVTNVGGTVATIGANGTRVSEVGWFDSGGGWVTTPSVAFNALPSWQRGTGVPTNLHYRLVPDVALHAAGSNDPNTDPGAYQFFFNHQNITEQGGLSGTSFSSPVYAGDFALVEQDLIGRGILKTTDLGKARLGRINDLIYAENGRADVWNDITVGANGILPNGQSSVATRGWDFVTGWGSTNFQGFANAIVAAAPTVYSPSAVQIYHEFGTSPVGSVGDLGATDGRYYTLKSVPTSIGAISSPQYTFQLKQAPSSLHSLTLTLVQNAPKNVSSLVYLYNYSTKLWNLESSTTMTGSNVTIAISPWNFPQFVNQNGTVTAVVRTIYPTNLGATSFTLSTDQATLTAVVATP